MFAGHPTIYAVVLAFNRHFKTDIYCFSLTTLYIIVIKKVLINNGMFDLNKLIDTFAKTNISRVRKNI